MSNYAIRNSLAKISYIIGYRKSTLGREKALQFVLKWISELFPTIEILIIEQDAVSQVTFELPAHVQHYFYVNPGLYNRSWSFNLATQLTDKEIFIFADADTFLNKEDYLALFESCVTEFEVSTPAIRFVREVGNLQIKTLCFSEFEKRRIPSFASKILAIRRDALDKIGGWDERFETWGGENEAISHLIVNTLRFKVFNYTIYHIEHPKEMVKKEFQSILSFNETIKEEIQTFAGKSIDRYIEFLTSFAQGQPTKYLKDNLGKSPSRRPSFALAVTTYNRRSYTKEFIDSWLETRDTDARWTLVIADDGSTDGTLEYLEDLIQKDIPNTSISLIKNDRKGIVHQKNVLLKFLSTQPFDLAFVSDDDLIFKQSGWDLAYWKVIQRTGYDHLIFHDSHWSTRSNRTPRFIKGDLESRALSGRIQGAFFTVTPRVISEVGFMDVFSFGFRGMEHVDYSNRCFRAGFNLFDTPFDLKNSTAYLHLRPPENYIRTVSDEHDHILNPISIQREKLIRVNLNRIFVPYNEVDISYEEYLQDCKSFVLTIDEGKNSFASTKRFPPDLHYASDRWIFNKGFSAFIGSLVKKMYNFNLNKHWYFLPRRIKKLGRFFQKIGWNLENIDDVMD